MLFTRRVTIVTEKEYPFRPDILWKVLVNNTTLFNISEKFEKVDDLVDSPSILYRNGKLSLLGFKVLCWNVFPIEIVENNYLGVNREFYFPFKANLTNKIFFEKTKKGTKILCSCELCASSLKILLIYYLAQKWIKGVFLYLDQFWGLCVQRKKYVFYKQANKHEKKYLLNHFKKCSINNPIWDKIVNFLSELSPVELNRIIPKQLEINEKIENVVYALLEATKKGIFTFRWTIFCVYCGSETAHFSSLKTIKKTQFCKTCQKLFDVDLEKSIKLFFSISIFSHKNKIDYNSYENLLFQKNLEPNKSSLFEIECQYKKYQLSTFRSNNTSFLIPKAENISDSGIITLSVRRGGWEKDFFEFIPGKNILLIKNNSHNPISVSIKKIIPKEDLFSAKNAITLSKFSLLFPNEIFDNNEYFSLNKISLLIVDIHNLYDVDLQEKYQSILSDWHLILLRLCEKYYGNIVKLELAKYLLIFSELKNAILGAMSLLLKENFDTFNTLKDYKIKASINTGEVNVCFRNGIADFEGVAIKKLILMNNENNGNELLLNNSCLIEPDSKIIDFYEYKLIDSNKDFYRLLIIDKKQAA